ncbi:MAG TPA: hypothetical protein VFG76_09270, partial [Candidatus Polarisedimenticolia bacterium]|nr:hypothetical protein [Candidatus Polarisedimenticolia bacterium]
PALHQASHRFPSFLPDGRHFLYLAIPGSEGGFDTFAASLQEGTIKKILTADSAVVYAQPGYLLFARDGKILAQPFDAGRLELSGEPVAIAEAPPSTDLDAEPVVSASDDERLVFLRSGVRSTRLEWIDRTGAVRGVVPLPPGPWRIFDLSLDTRHAAVMNGGDIWLIDLARAIPTRLAATLSKEANVVWLSDGRRIAFSSNRSGRAEVYIADVDATVEPKMIATTESQFKSVWDVSRDGRTVVFGMVGETTSWDIWVVPLEDGGKATLYESGSGQEVQARLSPDGKWLAYSSDGESGLPEIYVQSFPRPGRKMRISVDGGDFPTWTKGGSELLYTKGATIMSVPIGGGADLQPGAPRPILELPEGTTGVVPTPDGDRFLLTAGPEVKRDIRVILNWTSLLKQ